MAVSRSASRSIAVAAGVAAMSGLVLWTAWPGFPRQAAPRPAVPEGAAMAASAARAVARDGWAPTANSMITARSLTAGSADLGGADPTGDVDVFTGTSAGGNTFPGATLPFGMTQPSPDTLSRPPGGGYVYKDRKILGFSAVHLSGPGCPALGHVSVMPVTGPVTSTSDTSYASAFSHATEAARPGYYGVALARYGIKAELTATARTAWERFSFPASAATAKQVLFNLGAAQNATTDAGLRVTGPDTVTGYESTGAFCNPGYRPVTVYFTARFSEPFSLTGTWNHGPVTWDRRSVSAASAHGTAIGADLRFPNGTRRVTARIGVSYTSPANAAANLAAESPARGGFTAVKQRAHAIWRQWLNRIAVTGGTREQRETFYTALYHSLIEPNLFSDVNGQYPGMGGGLDTAANRAQYTNLSLWDTYRTQEQFLDLIAPDVARGIMLSLVSDTRELGWVPRWVLASQETNTMSGDSVSEMFADALAAGVVTPAEVRPVYPYLRDNAVEAPPAGSREDGRQGIAMYRAHGYVPFDPSSSSQYFLRSGASATLEYALADCGLSHVAGALGQTADATAFASSAHDYRDEFDASTGFFRPRLPDGRFLPAFNPAFVSLPYITADAKGYDEGSAWQYRWLVPQDPADLAALLGGTGAAIADLNKFFAFDQVAARPGTAARVWTSGARYDYGNEPDFQAPYTYDALGVPWRTQAVVRAARTVFRPAPGGLPGNDDLGEMSAWYVMSALGLYPYAAGQGTYVLTSPLFSRAAVTLPRPFAGPPGPFGSGRPLVITSPGGGTYVHGLSRNGVPHGKAWITRAGLVPGATLAYRTGPEPDRSWAAGPAAAPPAYCPSRSR